MTEMEKTARNNKFKGIARRDFLKIAGLIGLGLTLEEALSACGATPLETPTSAVIAETAQPTPTEIPPTPDQVLEQYRKLIEEKGNSYVRILSAKARAEGAPLEEKLKTFVNKLIAGRHIEQATLDIYQSEEEAKAAGTSYSLGNINPYGAPYIAFFDEKTRRAGFIFDVWESDKPLIATKEDAWEVFSKEFASNTEYANFISEKTGTSAESLIPDDFHLTAETNRLADLVFTPTGEAFLGVNHLTKRWEFIDHLGGLITVPVAAAQTVETPEKKPEGVALSDEALITELVNHSKETNTYPFGLTDEQEQAWFEELNRQRSGNNGLFVFEWSEDPNYMWIYVSPSLYPNFKEEFASEIIGIGAKYEKQADIYKFGDGSDTLLVSKDFFEKHPEVTERLRQDKWIEMRYETDKNGEKTGGLQYRNPITGGFVSIGSSDSLKPNEWSQTISADDPRASEFNPKAKVFKDEDLPTIMSFYEGELLPLVLLPIPAEGLYHLSSNPGIASWTDALPMLKVHFIKNELGDLVPIGEQVLLGAYNPVGGINILVDESNKLRTGESIRKLASEINEMKDEVAIPHEIYYATVFHNPQKNLRPGLFETAKTEIFIAPDKSYAAITGSAILSESKTILLLDGCLRNTIIRKQ